MATAASRDGHGNPNGEVASKASVVATVISDNQRYKAAIMKREVKG